MNRENNKQRGRPKGSKISNPASKTLSNVRVTEDQLEAYKAAAKHSGMTFSAWVRQHLDNATK